MKKRALLLLAVAAPYLRVLNAPFVYDDKMEVVGNRTIRALVHLDQIATYNRARPLLILTYALNWAVGGFAPLSYHLVSLALHLGNTLLALALARRLLSPERAWLVAAIWALHPMCIEAVTYTTGRSDAFVAAWMLGSVIAWIDGVRSGSRKKFWLAGGLWALGLASKEVAAVTPLLWLGAELWLVNGGRTALVEWRRYTLPAVIVPAAVAARVAWIGWPQPEVPRSALEHVLGQAEVWFVYLRLWLLPYGQSILHDYAVTARVEGIVAVIGILGIGALAARRRGVAAFGTLLWMAVLVVSSAFVLKETMAEHRSYVAGLGLVLALVSLVPYHRALWAVPVILAAATGWRNEAWRSEEQLWASATAVNPASAEAWYGYGDALRFRQRFGEAEAAFRESLRLQQDRPDTWVNLGIVRAEQGDAEGAEECWREALKRKPGHCAALNNLAASAARRGQTTQAVSGYLGTLRFCPDDPVANETLGNLYWALGDLSRSATFYERWLTTGPDGADAVVARRRVDQARAAGVTPR